MQIRYNLIKLDNALAFQVSKQSRALTRFLQSIEYFQASNGWKVVSKFRPDIDIIKETIYVRGTTKHLDSRVVTIYGIDNEYRDMLVDDIYKALQEMLKAAIEAQESEKEEAKDKDLLHPGYSAEDFIAIKSSVNYYSL